VLHKRLIPSLLLDRGRLVKGVRYANRRDAGNPKTTARAHNAQGADELILMDVSASRERRGPDYETIAAVAAECFMPLTVGGGITSADTARRCMEGGADKLCLTTAALDRPALIGELAEILGRQAVMIGIDVVSDRGERRLFDHRTGRAAARADWTGWMKEAVDRGAGEVRLMSVDREGTRSGFDVELLAEAETLVDVPIILEGGAGNVADIAAAMNEGAAAVAVGTMLVFSDNNLIQIKRHLSNHRHEMRL
jgi:cyclase